MEVQVESVMLNENVGVFSTAPAEKVGSMDRVLGCGWCCGVNLLSAVQYGTVFIIDIDRLRTLALTLMAFSIFAVGIFLTCFGGRGYQEKLQHVQFLVTDLPCFLDCFIVLERG